MFKNNMIEVHKKIQSIIGNVVEIKPIGNHDLKRHLVFLVETFEKSYVIKFYYVKNRWNREVAALKLLEDTDILVPHLVDYGKLDEVEWILYEYVNGALLDTIQEEIPTSNLKDIYFKAGEQLGLLHSLKYFEHYGILNEDLEFKNSYHTFKSYFQNEVERIFTNLNKFTHEEIDLINKAKKTLMKTLEFLNDNDIQARLCHNDFGARNLIVSKDSGAYKLVCVIDFEHSVIADADRELVLFYYSLKDSNEPLWKAFERGYEGHLAINQDSIHDKKLLYRLYRGLSICSWSQNVDKDHYDEGIKILKETLISYSER
ncbi:aminoglycoside phosphotransferase family protein [Vallitalea okinawensis]|uniref:aminoglycoside phosphotransferase family protein n=1 Tax=Vallitalea okinawensis TaxID=2078660 RepID=UPI00130072B0|nr:aminoglycoside phosphotransferase family protein [Vallitalea okinawensis]